MATFSPLVDELLPTNKANTRGGLVPNNTIVHGWAGTNRASVIATLVTGPARASTNYIIQGDWIAGSVPEELRAWTSGSNTFDSAAITVENANSGGAPGWPFSAATVDSLVALIADCARRYGKTSIAHGWRPQGSPVWGVIGHRDVPAQSTACPQSLWARLADLADRALQQLTEAPTLAATTYRVRPGDTLWAIARMFLGDGNRWPEIQAANNIRNPDILIIDTRLIIPDGAPAPSATIHVGGRAKFTGTRDYGGRRLQTWTTGTTFDVIGITGPRVVIGAGKAVTAAVNIADLQPM